MSRNNCLDIFNNCLPLKCPERNVQTDVSNNRLLLKCPDVKMHPSTSVYIFRDMYSKYSSESSQKEANDIIMIKFDRFFQYKFRFRYLKKCRATIHSPWFRLDCGPGRRRSGLAIAPAPEVGMTGFQVPYAWVTFPGSLEINFANARALQSSSSRACHSGALVYEQGHYECRRLPGRLV
jgi:hypothetical protein